MLWLTKGNTWLTDTQVLSIDKDSAKALFRRGKARRELQQTEQAEVDLQAASRLAPGDRAIISELSLVRQSLQADRQAQAHMFKGRLKPDPEPVSLQNSAQVQSWAQQLFAALSQCVQGLLGSFKELFRDNKQH